MTLHFVNYDPYDPAQFQRSIDMRQDLYSGNGQVGRFEQKFPTLEAYDHYLKSYLARNPAYVFWAWQDDVLVGHGIIKGSNEEWRQTDGYVDLVAVLPDYRGQGFGKDILAHCAELLHGDGFQTIWLNCVKANARNMQFYKSQGWQLAEDRPENLHLAVWEKQVA